MNHKPDQSSIEPNYYCRDCGWNLIFCLCNDEMSGDTKDPNNKYWDWYLYCSNKGCKNHEGGYFSCGNVPDFAESIRKG
jgi:hypothetical protein